MLFSGRFRIRAYMAAAAVLVLLLCVAGCTKEQDKKVQELDFTVVKEAELPEELKKIIDQKKTGAFKLTYTDGGDLYIAVGYGRQPTGGDSIQIPEVYLTDTNIVFTSMLLGPKQDEPANISYPYAVLKLEARQEPVLFQ